MPQDATRITKMELVRIPDDAAPLLIDAMMNWARNNAAPLWGRAIEGIPRFRLNLAMMRAALIGMECSPRLADQLGTILAARATMMEDEPLDAASAEADALTLLLEEVNRLLDGMRRRSRPACTVARQASSTF